ncbi:MAG: exodeoxyribonuclease V subunit gamma [Pseudomonadota bacterium]
MLRLYQSNRLEILTQRLVELLAAPVGLPLQPETLVVQHPGMARWLALGIADRAGICANIRFPLPGAFVWEVFSAFLPDVPRTNHFAPALLKWRVFELLEELNDQPLFRPVQHYLQQDDENRRFQLADRLAGLFDRYLVYRPDWILQWEAGQAAIPGDEWQAELWRRLTPGHERHWVGLQEALFGYSGERPPGLPERLFLIGVPTLSPGYLQVMQWLAQWTDIHLFLLNPCATHWADIVDYKALARQELTANGSELYLDVGNPLLASLGRQGRDFFAAINEFDPGSEEWFVDPGGRTLLNRLQQQILRLEAPGDMSLQDDSIRFQIFHSAMREVESLYDQLLAMLDESPDLIPAEILVMTPDIDTYAPLIDAVFSVPGDRPAIPYRISDQALHQANHHISAFLELLKMPGSRFSVNKLLGLLEIPTIHQRFGLDEAALEALTIWIDKANIRWGRDGQSKSNLGLPNEPRNTWRAGLEQMLLGFAMPAESDELWQGIAPLNAVEGSDSEWLGGLLSFCESIFRLEEQLAKPHSLASWGELLLNLIDAFFKPDQDAELPLQQLRDGIQQLRDDAEATGFSGEVSLPLVRQQLEQTFSQPTSRGFLGGGVNFCALAPMRSLPFRVICLIGMNEGSFPRQQPIMGFDLMSRRFRFGDRSRRADDRYLFLETLLSARQMLYISHVGRSIKDNSSLPPSVLVDELRDYLARQIGEEGLNGLTQAHPLQAYSPDYFMPEKGFCSYSSRMREAALLAGQGHAQSRPLVIQPLPETGLEIDQVGLKQLLDFFTNPARGFARQRLNLQLEAAGVLLDEREAFSLEKYTGESLERELVHALMAGQSGQEFYQKLDAKGELPHGRPGQYTFQKLLRSAQQMKERLESLEMGEQLPARDFVLRIEDMSLDGRLHGLYPAGQIGFNVGSYHAYLKLNLWIRHLLLSQLRPAGIECVSVWLEKEGQGRFRPVDDPGVHLSRLLDLYRQGLCAPLHFYPGSSWVYAENLISKGNPEAAVNAVLKKWLGNDRFPGDWDKPYQQLLMARDAALTNAFHETSLAIFEPLIEHLEAV